MLHFQNYLSPKIAFPEYCLFKYKLIIGWRALSPISLATERAPLLRILLPTGFVLFDLVIPSYLVIFIVLFELKLMVGNGKYTLFVIRISKFEFRLMVLNFFENLWLGCS